MIITKIDTIGRIITGPEVQSQIDTDGHGGISEDFRCPICNQAQTYMNNSGGSSLEFFAHSDGSSDCFQSKPTSEEHQLATEITVMTLYNRIREVTGEPMEINVEKWIGNRRDFVIADIRVTSPIRLAAEIFYKVESLALGRRFRTMFDKEYQAYLIFHRDGRHDATQVENHIQRVAPLRVGRFNPDTLETTLGDLFSQQQISMRDSNLDRLPDYIVAG